jgi:hypothetical protein
MEEYHVSYVLRNGQGIRKDWLLHAADEADAKAQITYFHYLDNQQVYIVTSQLYKPGKQSAL